MSFGPFELLVILIIVVLLFGTKKLRSLGGDLGSAIKSFREALKEGDDSPPPPSEGGGRIIEGEAESKSDTPKDAP